MSAVRFGAVIQARRNSNRLPNKVVKLLQGKPMLFHVITRVKQAKLIDRVFLATTDRIEDEELARIAEKAGVETYRGSQDDVLDRYYKAALKFDIRNIVRITADCPLIDPIIVDLTIKEFLEGNYDYVSNALKPTFPDGLDTEVFTFEALERAWKNARLLSEREHVTPYIWKNPSLFRLGQIVHETDLSHMRWTVDNKEDLIFARRVYKYLYSSKKSFSYLDVLELIRRHPDLATTNSNIPRNEGYKRSVKNDVEIGEAAADKKGIH